jgi:hypothetical protein
MGVSLLFAQTKPTPKPTPSPLSARRVNGIVRDSLGRTIPMASVRLLSVKDTLSTVTSEYGVFNFTHVQAADFIIQVYVMSYNNYQKKYFLNDTKSILILPPVVMTSGMVQLKGIVVTTAKGPQERGDTTEFWAKDYIVRDYARLEDLLKRMEGVTIDANGILNYRGKLVSRALFNGKKYFSGDVMAAIKELPADIVERIQIIDDNEDGTGPKIAKSDASSKTLNIVTKADKSAGRMYQTNLEAGTQDRYKAALSARSIDGSQQWGIAVGAGQEPAGIASGDPIGTINNMMMTTGAINFFNPGGSGGMGKNAGLQLTYNNELGKLRYNLRYGFNKINIINESASESTEFFPEGSIFKKQQNKTTNSSLNHSFSLDASMFEKNFNMNTSLYGRWGEDKTDLFSTTRQTGMLENLQQVKNSARSKAPQLGLYSRITLFPQRKLALDVSIASRYSRTNGTNNESTDIYGLTSGTRDSALLLQQNTARQTFDNELEVGLRSSSQKKLRVRLTTKISQSERTDFKYTDELKEGMDPKHRNDLSNDNTLTNYKLPAKLAVEYNFNSNFSIELNGAYEINWQHSRFRTKELDLSTSSGNFLPGFYVKYIHKRRGNLSFFYSRNIRLPDLLQLNATPYYNTPFDIVVGNKDLKAGLNNVWSLNYNSFIPVVKLDVNATLTYSEMSNNIIANRFVQIDTVTKTMRTETHFANVKGGSSKNANYGLSRRFATMQMTLNFSGSVSFGKDIYMANNVLQLNDNVRAGNELNAVLSPFKWLDLTPKLSYNTYNSKNSLIQGGPVYNKDFTGSLKGGIFLPRDITINLNAVQNITRATNLLTSTHPLVINANIEKRFLKKRDAVVSFVVMDALQQNSSTRFGQMQNGYVNSLTNSKSRYFLCQLSWYPQQFTRGRSAHGARRGDGSFVK